MFAIKLPPQLNQVNSTRVRINTPSLTAVRECASGSGRPNALIMKRSECDFPHEYAFSFCERAGRCQCDVKFLIMRLRL